MEAKKLTKPQENKLSTFEDIETVLDNHSEIINRIGEFAVTKTEFSSVISAIRQKAVLKNTITRGVTEAKSAKRIELENLILKNSATLYVLGQKKGNEIIKAVSKITQTELDRVRDSDIVNKANSVLNLMESNITQLESFGKNAGSIEELRSCITEYQNSSRNKSASVSEKSVLNISLRELFAKGMSIIVNELDKFVDSLKSEEKDFYNKYYSVRSIKNLGIRHKKPQENKSTSNPA